MNTPNDIKPNNDVLRQAMQRRKARRPIHELPEGFEDRVMERIKDIQIPVKDDSSSKKKGTVIRLWSLRTVGVAASIAGLLFVYNRMTISDGVVDNNNMMAKTEVVRQQPQRTIKTDASQPTKHIVAEPLTIKQVARVDVSQRHDTDESISSEQQEEKNIETINLEEDNLPDMMLSINDAERVMDDFMKQYEGIASVSASPVTEQEHNANEVSYHVMHEIAQNMNEFTKQHNNLSNGGTTYGY